MIKTEPIIIRSATYVKSERQWEFMADSAVEGKQPIEFTAQEDSCGAYTALLSLCKHLPVHAVLTESYILLYCMVVDQSRSK